MEAADFSGYATKAGLKCSDGRTITAEAFQHMDGQQVPLVWQHSHDEPTNVLGHAVLEARPANHPEGGGMYAYAFLNESASADHVRTLVRHKDVDSFSIYANQLLEQSKRVLHGVIREVSVVLSGANPGAKIDFIALQHSDGSVTDLEDAAIITTGLEIVHGDLTGEGDEQEDDESLEHAEDDADEETVQDVYDSMNAKQKDVLHYMIGAALEAQAEAQAEAKHSATESEDAASNDESEDDASNDDNNTEGDLTHQEGSDMTRNVFDQDGSKAQEGHVLTHDAFSAIIEEAKKPGNTLKEALLAHAATYGIEDINLLFPDAKATSNQPELNSRRMEWVAQVLGGTKHTPFAKVKSTVFDITAEEARAKGYIKGSLKKEEVIKLLRRTTGPTTIYKKQKLDRDDVLDITDMDVVTFLKGEMRLMIEEEIARAILVGDGRPELSEDKVKDPEGSLQGDGIRSILNDDPFYSVKHQLAANVAPKDAVKGLVRARSKYRGTGKPTLFISDNFLTDIMLEEDKFGRALYATEQALADKLRVKDIVTVDLFDDHADLFAIMVNLADYSIGANKGGELTSFEDFDIDYNQHKYLQETRLSGALTKPFSAVVVLRAEGVLATAAAPSFDGATNTVTIPASEGVVYQVNDEPVAAGPLVISQDTEVEAVADEGYYLAPNTTRSWNYTYTP